MKKDFFDICNDIQKELAECGGNGQEAWRRSHPNGISARLYEQRQKEKEAKKK